jgi:hypothetical protein
MSYLAYIRVAVDVPHQGRQDEEEQKERRTEDEGPPRISTFLLHRSILRKSGAVYSIVRGRFAGDKVRSERVKG